MGGLPCAKTEPDMEMHIGGTRDNRCMSKHGKFCRSVRKTFLRCRWSHNGGGSQRGNTQSPFTDI